MPVHITTAENMHNLAHALAGSVGGVRSDPFVEELIVVPSAGLQRWLEQQLAVELGVAANLRFLLPGALTAKLRSMSGATESDSWRLDAITGQVFRLGNPYASEDATDWTGELQGPGSWMARARYIADLFDRYGMHRPHMLRNWAIGNDVGGDSEPLADAAVWQPRLWRAVREQLGPAPAEQLMSFLADLATHDMALTKASRVHVFGLSAMSVEFVQVLRALAVSTDMRLFVPVTSDTRAGSVLRGQGEDPTHPLLATWGRTERDGLGLLREHLPEPAAAADRLTVEPTLVSLLGQLQQQIRLDATPSNADVTADTSMQFHACSGESRQVEVLKDAILHLLKADASLNESDILVMCPQLRRYAPLIEASWGLSARHDESTPGDRVPSLRYAINQGSLNQAAPIIEALQRLLALVRGSVTHSELAAFLALEPVRLRFGFSEDYDLATATEWLGRTAMRWGLNVDHRQRRADLPTHYQAHTLKQSSTAIVGSMAFDEAEIMPAGPAAIRLDLSQFELAAQLGDLTTTLEQIDREWVAGRPADATVWVQRLDTACRQLFAVADTERWQLDALRTVIESIHTVAPDDTLLSIDDLADAIDDAVATRSGWRHFGTGAIIIDQPQALRAVPHRVICLLGFDDDAIPSPGTSGDDLIASHPLPGDRDRRLESKQQLLEAVLSATDTFVVTFSSHNIHTNAEIPPSVALQELLDAAATVAGVRPGQLIRQHARHRWAPSNFELSNPWSFDGSALEIEVARRARSNERWGPADPLPAEQIDAVSLRELVLAASDPSSIYVRDRLGVSLPRPAEQPGDLLPASLSTLERWSVGNGLLHARAKGQSAQQWEQHARSAGHLPPGALGKAEAADAEENVDTLLDAVRQITGVDYTSVTSSLQPISLEIRGTKVLGLVELLNDQVLRVRWSSRKGADDLALWIDALVLSQIGHFEPAFWFSRKSKSLQVLRCRINPDAQAACQTALAYLCDLHRQARREPIALFPNTTRDIANNDLKSARQSWKHRTFSSGDSDRAEIATMFAGVAFDDLLRDPINAQDQAAELHHHIAATTSDWSDS